jgi:Alpha-glutamyl/putrescinyl thymine pyrophosphorylase clade 2
LSTRTYPRLGLEDFGRALLRTNDLDPVYVMLWNSELPPMGLLKRWLIAYWCYYSCGAASYIAEREGQEFWNLMMRAARNEEPAPTGGRWPRGHERRHFRGAKAIASVQMLWEEYGPHPERMVDHVAWLEDPRPTPAGVPCAMVMTRVQQHHQFGKWIAFKVADMIERLGIQKVTFTMEDVLEMDSPRKAAVAAYWEYRKEAPQGERQALDYVMGMLLHHDNLLPAPPRMERSVGLQEAETVLCKWGSHLTGHYPVGHDIDEIREGMGPWAAHSHLAGRLLSFLPTYS